jgi:hypothetical protein
VSQPLPPTDPAQPSAPDVAVDASADAPAGPTIMQRFRATQQLSDSVVARVRERAQEAEASPEVAAVVEPGSPAPQSPRQQSGDEPAPAGDTAQTHVQRIRTTGSSPDPAVTGRGNDAAWHFTPPAQVAGGRQASSIHNAMGDQERTDADALCNLTSAPMLELPDDEHQPLPHECEGRYSVVEALGHGGMGTVLRVRDTGLKRDVAMKVLRADLAHKVEYINALRREARIIGGLEHPSIIPLHELGTRLDGATYYTMKLMPSRSLGEVIQHLQLGYEGVGDLFSLRRLVGVFVQIAQGMEYAHSKGVVHRDLKPENVLLGDFGEVQITDWGIAKRQASPRPPNAEGLIVGTPAYMSPEQAAGHDSEVDHRSDIYALGVMLYEVLALKRPYGGENSQQQLEATKNVVPLPPSVVARDRSVPPDLEAVAMRMLEKKRERRPQSMRDVWQALERYLAGEQERERLRERADECYRHGLEELARYEGLRFEREFAMQEERDLCRDVRPWHSQAQKQNVWAVRHRLQMLEVLYAHAFATASDYLRQAIDQGDGHTKAREKLIELYWHRHDEAAAAGDNATKLFFARQAHDLSEHGGRQTGVLHIRSQPPGARIYAIPFDEIRGSLGRPSPQYEIGCAPLNGIELPLGPYVLMARLDGHRDALETLYVRETNGDILLLCYPWSSELPLIGREVELGQLWLLLQDAEVRSRPVTCLVAGAMGMGKNVLLDAFRRSVEQHPTKTYFLLEVSCSRLRRDLPYATLADLIRLRAGILETDTADQARAKLQRMVAQAFSRLGQRKLTPDRLAEADRIANTIGALPAFDIEDPTRMGIREEMATEGRRALTEALATYFQAVAVATPVLMLIRHAQHMDASSRTFFNDLLSLLKGSPLLMVASSTEADDVAGLQSSALRHLVPHQPPFHFDQQLALDSLSERAVACLVRDMLAAPVDSELLAWIQAHALGAPFLTGELVHMLARTGAMELQAAEWRLVRERLPADVRPGNLESVLRVLVGTLPPHVQHALSAAVVVGAEFWAGCLRDLGVQQVDDALEQLVQAGIVVRNATCRYPGDREYRLSSNLRRRVAYDKLAPRERRAMHRRVAAWIARHGRTDLEESARLAHHLEMGGQPEEAALLYARIGKAATSVGAEEEAERLYTHAHVLSTDPELQGGIEVALRAMSARSRERVRD